MGGKVVTFCNRKGGVGKTTTTLCVAFTLQTMYRRSVAVVDADPQASASLSLAGVDRFDTVLLPYFLEKTLNDDTLDGPRPELEHVCFTGLRSAQGRGGFGLAPISPEFWAIEDQLLRSHVSVRSTPQMERFRRLLALLREAFDYVLIDTAPGRSVLFDEAVIASDFIILPCVPDRMSVWGLRFVREEIHKLMNFAERDVPLRVVWTQYGKSASWRDWLWTQYYDRRDAVDLLSRPTYENGVMRPAESFRRLDRKWRHPKQEFVGIRQSTVLSRLVSDHGLSPAAFQKRLPQPIRDSLALMCEQVMVKLEHAKPS